MKVSDNGSGDWDIEDVTDDERHYIINALELLLAAKLKEQALRSYRLEEVEDLKRMLEVIESAMED